MLPKTPMKNVIFKNFYRNARLKVAIKNHAQNSANTSLSKKGRNEFLVKKYHAKVPSKTLAKKCSLQKTVLNYSSWTFVRKSCLRSCRQHLNTIQKSTVQKSCPQHRQWSAFKKRPKLNARQNVIVEKCYSKHRYKLLSIGTLMEMLVKTYQLQKLPKKPPILTFQKKAVLTSSSKSTTQRFRPKHWQKVVPGKRLYWNTRHVLFPKEMTKPASTVSICSSERYRTNILPKTPTIKRNQKTREMERSSKCYHWEMLPKTPMKNVIFKNFYRNARLKVAIKNHAQNSANTSLSKESCFEFLVKNTVQMCRPKYWLRFVYGKKLYWDACHELFAKKTTKNTNKLRIWKKNSFKMLVKEIFVHKSCVQRRWEVKIAIEKKEQFEILVKQTPYKKTSEIAVKFCLRKKTVSKCVSFRSVPKLWPENR